MARPLSSPMTRRRSAVGHLPQIPRFDRQQLLMRALRLGGQHLVGRNQPLVQTAAEIAQVRVERIERPLHDRFGLGRGHQRPERAGGFETGVEAGRGHVESGGFPLRAGGARRAPPAVPPV